MTPTSPSSSQKPSETTPPREACQPSFSISVWRGWSRETVSGPWVGLGEAAVVVVVVVVAARVDQGVSELCGSGLGDRAGGARFRQHI